MLEPKLTTPFEVWVAIIQNTRDHEAASIGKAHVFDKLRSLYESISLLAYLPSSWPSSNVSAAIPARWQKCIKARLNGNGTYTTFLIAFLQIAANLLLATEPWQVHPL
jgi:hypothetical protein